MHIYFDDSSNTGPWFLDPNQSKYFIMAGISVEEEKVKAIEGILHQWEKDNLKKKAKEVKGAKFFKNSNSLINFYQLVVKLNKIGFIPIYGITEKRYALAAVLVETFFDPAYNTAISNENFFMAGSREAYAEALFDFFDDVNMNLFNNVIRNESPIDFELFISSISEIQNDTIDFKKLLSTLDKKHALDFLVSDGQRFKLSPNFFTFSSVYHRLVKSLEDTGSVAIIFHDEQEQFQKHFEELHLSMKGDSPTETPIEYGGRTIIWGSNTVKSLHFDSDSPILRFCDLMCAFIQKFINNQLDDHNESKKILPLLAHLVFYVYYTRDFKYDWDYLSFSKTSAISFDNLLKRF